MPEYNLGHVKGTDGKGIESIIKTNTEGLVDTYTITYTNGDTQTYTVTNGRDGSSTVDDSLSTVSVNPVQNKVITNAINNKINTSDIVDNLTTNDATKVLSAKQGKVLYDLISGIEEDMLL